MNLPSMIVLVAIASGCAPVTLGARAIQPSQAVDTPQVWIYLQTNNAKKDGIYRCSEIGGIEPVCKQAKMVYQEQ